MDPDPNPGGPRTCGSVDPDPQHRFQKVQVLFVWVCTSFAHYMMRLSSGTEGLVYLEVLLCLGWEAADDVCDNGDPGHAGLQVVHHLLKLGTRHGIKSIYLEIQ